jgi:hypothetical protein
MAFTEKSNWVVVVVSLVTFVAYLAMIVPPALAGPLAKVGYEQPIVVTIVFFIAANVLGNIVAAASNPTEADRKDQRDTEIDHFGSRVGNSLIIASCCVALALAMTKQDYFWIGNTLYLGGLFAALLGSSIKVAAYHTSFQRWRV